MKVIPLHDGRPSLNDIPGRLRLLADQLETDKYNTDCVLVVMPQSNDFPLIFGYGNVDGANDPIIQLQLALHRQLTYITKRG